MSARKWFLLALIPAAGFAALCVDSAWRLGEKRPDFRRCTSDPDRYDGRHVWIGGYRVSETLPDGFAVDVEGRTARVRSSVRPRAGSWIAIRGTYRKPDVVEADDVRPEPSYDLQRGGVYGISAVVLAIWLWSFLRRFKIGFRGGLFHPRVTS